MCFIIKLISKKLNLPFVSIIIQLLVILLLDMYFQSKIGERIFDAEKFPFSNIDWLKLLWPSEVLLDHYSRLEIALLTFSDLFTILCRFVGAQITINTARFLSRRFRSYMIARKTRCLQQENQWNARFPSVTMTPLLRVLSWHDKNPLKFTVLKLPFTGKVNDNISVYKIRSFWVRIYWKSIRRPSWQNWHQKRVRILPWFLFWHLKAQVFQSVVFHLYNFSSKFSFPLDSICWA